MLHFARPVSDRRFLGDYTSYTATGSRQNTKERKVQKMIAKFLFSCIAFSWWIETNIVSVLLFGEYPYPVKDEQDL